MAERNVYLRADGKWAWKLIGDNESDIIATDGGQGYEDEDYCREMADKIVGGDYKGAKKTTTKPKKK